jgi:DNA-binding MarR family transcriptional regulator
MGNTKTKTKMNPKSLANLKPCKPGETHNPHGRPKTVKEIRDAMLADTPTLVSVLKRMALKGNATAMRIWIDRVLPALTSMELSDTRIPQEDLSNLTDEQLTEVTALEQRIKDIKTIKPTEGKQGDK